MATLNRPPKEEIARRAKEIYEANIRPIVEKDNIGKYVVIDIVSGGYEMDGDYAAASERAAAKYPDGVRFALRIGYPALGRIGFQLREAMA